MRAVINISLPQQMVNIIDESVKSGKFASKSEFFRHLIREWHDNKLLRELEQSRLEFASGKAKVLKSLKSLR
ncbi:hypothetical protein A2962_04485 [Candidatus Woesebacteria bacterium RIFCSPLOWO2_01_FULL_39_61]|uniref:Ribbon-helix-helix protein CopG domain-containing protein n=1 Tax=Candidatus Woesebacteria bacterium RIFCSPHIGHO2_02_FULL_39_13 TaxID=1802505 RepID=A0A1F7Z0E7_9BACT|nr:MAG: hypothetical protein A2692_00940 [Candidatus Woesebacteria bacterium RIFCSPHIGHO2_01_FULL_39_95]OGM33106.1 MAG: hypothetical protein A3D01_05090 [Candidatus Woesebacteria bacterium RIFCSPHIGHO2_02_FULL_39_13]OGM38058.1 MAG: hypothetical protein A3E13_03755 [Candidatus Woesebacteria bacterium RIFCSPHIGHO2_12_FULL_40_20]OGM66580.1 MAG: hypothetical protein A2962_04485 [Candidatus Woesebacteria bacterium RIFCSPLOWO2_01_FULL_39_61]OGM73770.1 MAG: hypothetical protein A3H19_02080 [Candidatus